jgi:hypothetical protein
LAAFGARYALRTLRVIEKQTAALIESQRPKIAVTAHDDPFQMLCGPSPHRVEIDLDNKGLGVARNLTYETWIELLPLPFVDFTSGADHFASTDPMVLYPNHEPLTINIPIRTGLTARQLDDLRHFRICACIRILVHYDDAFGPNRTVSFGLVVRHNGLGYLPKYNQDC